MKFLKNIRKFYGSAFAFAALLIANTASTQFSLIYYQESVPEKVRELKK